MYSIRDLLGHFAKRPFEGRPCPHACCKGRRRHPDKLPVILDRKTLRSLPDDQLAKHVRWNNDKSVEQVMSELERRDRADKLKRDRGERRRMRDSLQREEHRIAVHASYLAAEQQTRGYMLNKAGKAKGIDPRTLFTGPESRVKAYASEELRGYFDQHGRITAAAYRDQARRQRAEYEHERLYGVY